MRIYVLACQHGDEPFGLKIIGNLQLIRNDNIRLYIAHPQALAKGKRYLESDLNRSFSPDSTTLEARIAAAIVKDINAFNPDAILDIHTSCCKMQDVGIATVATPYIRQLAASFGLSTLVVMPPKFAEHSLIGQFPDTAISLEFGKNHRSDKLALAVANQINSLSDGLIEDAVLPDVLRVHTTIPKDYKNLATVINLQEDKELGGYPFLADINAYSTIGGFLALKDN